MSDQQSRPQIQPNPLDVMSTWMYADPVAGATKRPNFRLKVIGNVPRFVVKTNVPDDKNNGRIDFNTDLATFSVILHKIEEIASGRDDRSYTAEYVDDFIAGKKLDKPVVIASVKVGKEAQTGRVYIAVLGYNRPKIQFFFGPSRYHALKLGDGSVLSEGEVSQAYAMGFVRGYAPIVQQLMVTEFNPDAKNVAKAPTGPGGYGGNQNQGNRGQNGNHGSSNRSRPQPTMDDDIDFAEDVTW